MTNTETNDKAANVAEQGAHVAPEKASSKKGASKKKGALKARRAPRPAIRKRGPKPRVAGPRRAKRAGKSELRPQLLNLGLGILHTRPRLSMTLRSTVGLRAADLFQRDSRRRALTNLHIEQRDPVLNRLKRETR